MESKELKNEVPKGFDVRVGRERGDGWLKKSAGLVVFGRLLGRYIMKGHENDDGTARVFYQIRLGEGSQVSAVFQDEETKEKKEVILTEGKILNVDEHKALEDLEAYAKDGGVYDVWMKYVEQRKMSGKGNRTFWDMKGPFLKTIKPGRPHAEARRVETEEEIPF